ncbi:A disintegrin and metalloproteinase with thrombospondin motifs 3-like [Gigantopelta aegis]|uniref:A disintegrin and metalloproteinase with thrombospondin motifs 3-like n=1 Tax=Gigantopelta aegis TaxID=1735272 RepID=UPI001B88B2A4|nr:A disintegrin and metalloproteinase with thrombospondin motifs 3-like [Gigantopelta aegis]
MEMTVYYGWDMLLLLMIYPLIVPHSCKALRQFPKDFEVVFTSYIDVNGMIISHDQLNHSRRRRNAPSSSSSSSLDQDIFMNITGKRVHFHLRLSPNKKLLAPGFKVYHRRHANTSDIRGNTFTDSTHNELRDCIYTENPLQFSLTDEYLQQTFMFVFIVE